MSTLFDVQKLLTEYGYIGVFVIVLLESGVIFALPGDSLLFTAGLLASTSGLNLFFLIPIIFFGTFLGGVCGYGIGRYLEHFHKYAFFRKVLKPEYILEAHKFFDKHGKPAILLSRFVPLMRTFTPIAAGVARMNKHVFVRYSLISSVLWSTSITLLGYFLGQSFPQIKDYLSYFLIGVVAVSLIPVAIGYLRERRKRSRTT